MVAIDGVYMHEVLDEKASWMTAISQPHPQRLLLYEQENQSLTIVNTIVNCFSNKADFT
jgi:hypothetical protein